MTPEELRELCEPSGSLLALAAAFSDLDETARKMLSKAAQDIYREAHNAEPSNWDQMADRECRAGLAMLACCPWSQAKRIHGRQWGLFRHRSEDFLPAIVRILTDRRPAWAGDWVNLQLDDAASAWECLLDWRHVRELMKSGVIERPGSDGYVRVMATSPGVSIELPIDPDVIERDVWRLFEVESLAFDFLPEPRKVDRGRWQRGERATQPGQLHEVYDGLPRRLYELACKGHIDRGRLIDAVLAAFWRDFRSPMRTGLSRFLEIVDPTEEEIATREAAYLELLRNEHGPAVGLAIRGLTKLQKAGGLDIGDFLAAVPPAFSTAAKVHVKSALSLIDRVTKKAPEQIPAALNAVAAALNHESSDIQEQAVELLAKWKNADGSLDLSRLLESATMMAPQHRRTLASLVGKTSDEPTTSPLDDSSEAGEAHELDERAAAVLKRLAALPEWVRNVCGLSDLAEAMEQGRLSSVFNPPAGACPVLPGVEPVEPIRDVDELIDVTARVLAASAQPEDDERVVDAIFRLGKDSTDNFHAKTEGLRNSVETRLAGTVGWFGGAAMWEIHALHLIIGRWLGLAAVSRVVDAAKLQPDFSALAKLVPGVTDATLEATLRRALSTTYERLTPLDWKYVELFERLNRGEYGPVLSTPTHAAGWIDPRVFVARLNELQQRQIPIGKRDFIGGVLRLAPDYRDTALQSANDLSEPDGRVVRYALGGDEQPTREDRDQADEWLAAGRARHPRGHLTELAILGLSADEPDGITPATYQLDAAVHPTDLRHARWSTKQARRCMQVTPDKPGDGCGKFRPTVALAAQTLGDTGVVFFQEAPQHQIATVTPSNTDSIMALAAQRLFVRMDDKASAFAPVGGLMSPLLHVDRGWSDIARVTLWLGLVSRDDQARGIAMDALIDGIADGRADIGRLSDTLLEIAASGWIKLNRLADSLHEVSRTSVLAERFVAEILDRVIASWGPLPFDAHHVLSLQLGLLANLRCGPSSQVRRLLGGVKGSGKVARLAKQLCSLAADESSCVMRLAAIEAAEGRLPRAERIARHISDSG